LINSLKFKTVSKVAVTTQNRIWHSMCLSVHPVTFPATSVRPDKYLANDAPVKAGTSTEMRAGLSSERRITNVRL
jgi:hypothetical protein